MPWERRMPKRVALVSSSIAAGQTASPCGAAASRRQLCACFEVRGQGFDRVLM
jgi:hypothetical protein